MIAAQEMASKGSRRLEAIPSSVAVKIRLSSTSWMYMQMVSALVLSAYIFREAHPMKFILRSLERAAWRAQQSRRWNLANFENLMLIGKLRINCPMYSPSSTGTAIQGRLISYQLLGAHQIASPPRPYKPFPGCIDSAPASQRQTLPRPLQRKTAHRSIAV